MPRRPTSPVLARSSFQSLDYFAAPSPPRHHSAPPSSVFYFPTPPHRPQSMISSSSFSTAFDLDSAPHSPASAHKSLDAIEEAPQDTVQVLEIAPIATPTSERQRQSVHISRADAVNWARPLREHDLFDPETVRIFGQSQQRQRRLKRAAAVATHQQPASPPSSDDEPQPLTPPSVSTDSVFARLQRLPSPKEVGLGVMGINWDCESASSSSSPLLDAQIRPSPRRQVSFTLGTSDRPKSHLVAPEMGEPIALAASLSRSATTMSRQSSSAKEKKIKRKAVPSLPLDDMLEIPRRSGSTSSHSTAVIPPIPTFPDMLELSKRAGGLTMHTNLSTISVRPMHTLEVAPPLPRTPTTPRPDGLLSSPPRSNPTGFVKGLISSPALSPQSLRTLDDSFASPPLDRKKTLRGFYANARGAKSAMDLSSRKISPPLPSQITIPARRSSHVVVHGPTPILEQPERSPSFPPRLSSLHYHGLSHWSDTSDSGRSSGDGASLSGGSLSEPESEIRTPAPTIGKTSFIEEMDQGMVRLRAKGSSLSSDSAPTGPVEKLRAEDGGKKSGRFLGRSTSLMKAKKGFSKLLHRASAQ